MNAASLRPSMNARVIAVCVGRSEILTVPHGDGWRDVASAIRKLVVSDLADPRPVKVSPLGLEGDEQADLSVHGGRSQALYLYPSKHYPFWDGVRRQAGLTDGPLKPGAFGENLVVEGLDEHDLWIGDQLEIGTAVAAVSAPREPCFKFNHVMGFKQAASMMRQSGFMGAYLTVIRDGELTAGDKVVIKPGRREIALIDLIRLKRKR